MPTFECTTCRTSLTAGDHQAGQLVRCPTCMGTLRVPYPASTLPELIPVAATATAASAPAPPRLPPAPPIHDPYPHTPPPQLPASGLIPPGAPRPTGRRYGFQCGYCSSRLEATESQGGTEGTCPTCDQKIIIPILDRYGRLIDPRTQQIVKPDPHPVHAYAAAGERAPNIKRKPDGSQEIICPRCAATSPISANNCRTCGNPFTIEGANTDTSGGESSGLAAASLVLGIVSIFAFCLYIPGPLAIGFAAWSLYRNKDNPNASKGLAYAGIILGSIGTALTVFILFK